MKPDELIARAQAKRTDGTWPTRPEIAKEAARLAYEDAAEDCLTSSDEYESQAAFNLAQSLRAKAAALKE